MEGRLTPIIITKLLRATYTKWTADHAQGLGAALAFHTVFSLAPFLLIVIAIAGLVFGQEAAEGQIIRQIQSLVGEESAKAIQSMIEEARKPAAGVIAMVLAIAMMLLVANRSICSTSGSDEYDLESGGKVGGGYLENPQRSLHIPDCGSRNRIPAVDLLGHQRRVIGDKYNPGTYSSNPGISVATHQCLRVIFHRHALIRHDLQTAP